MNNFNLSYTNSIDYDFENENSNCSSNSKLSYTEEKCKIYCNCSEYDCELCGDFAGLNNYIKTDTEIIYYYESNFYNNQEEEKNRLTNEELKYISKFFYNYIIINDVKVKKSNYEDIKNFFKNIKI